MSRLWIWVALLVLAAALFLVRTQKLSVRDNKPEDKAALTNAVKALAEQESALAQKYWGPELLAQKHGAVFERLWDALNSASNKFAVLKEFRAPKMIWAARGPAREAAHGIQIL